MKLPGCKTWSLGMCKSSLGQQSYNVEVAGQIYWRNRRQLRATSEMAPLGTVDDLTLDKESPSQPVNDKHLLLAFHYRRVLA